MKKETQGMMWKHQLEHPGVRFPDENWLSSPALLECNISGGATQNRNRAEADGKKKKKKERIVLSPDASEVASKWAAYRHSSTSSIANDPDVRNRFLNDFAELYGVDIRGKDHCMLHVPADDVAAVRKMKQRKSTAADMALVDGKERPMGRSIVDPPGIYRGRGGKDNMLTGRIRRRIYPEDVTLNLSRGALVPRVPIEGHAWGAIVHDRHARWLAKWDDPVTSRTKYVYLADVGDVERDKFDLIQRLLPSFDAMREKNLKNCSNSRQRDIATCAAFIFELALRIGSLASRRTFGAATLLKKHVTLHIEDGTIDLSFPGKDSVPYVKARWQPPSVVFANLADLTFKKKSTDRIFDGIRPSHVNLYLSTLHAGLTARVLRTLCANRCFLQALHGVQITPMQGESRVVMATEHFRSALLTVAQLCNHQKHVAPTSAPEYVTRTALANYLDPRITLAYATYHGISKEKDLAKLLPKGLLKRFSWARSSPSSHSSSASVGGTHKMNIRA